jgi:hypothetical protein
MSETADRIAELERELAKAHDERDCLYKEFLEAREESCRGLEQLVETSAALEDASRDAEAISVALDGIAEQRGNLCVELRLEREIAGAAYRVANALYRERARERAELRAENEKLKAAARRVVDTFGPPGATRLGLDELRAIGALRELVK